MEEKNIAEIYKIDEKLAKTLINKHFYFSEHGKESEFSKLPGHYQRAINREAEFQVKTLAQTEGFKNLLDDKEEAQKYHNAFCEYYAHKGNQDEQKHPNHPNNLFNVLLERDSKAIALNPFEMTEKEDIFDKTSRNAKHINRKIAKEKAEGKEHDPQKHLEQMYKGIQNFLSNQR